METIIPNMIITNWVVVWRIGLGMIIVSMNIIIIIIIHLVIRW